MNKKIISGISAFAICVVLTGCGHEHTWTEATCTEPKTCSECGETEGEALGHTWVEAACAEPKTCSVCKETEGEALGHTWIEATCTEAKHCNVCGEIEGEALAHTLTEANYQQAATCEVCGETVGEPLQAYFEKYGLICNAELDTTYTLTGPCYLDQNYTTEGEITFSDYEVFESDENHEAKDGYEWKAVTVTQIFDNDNARDYAPWYSYMWWSDYYDEAWNDTDSEVFSYNGVDIPECIFDSEILQDLWTDDGVAIREGRYYVCTPIEYDGIVFCIFVGDEIEYIRDLADKPEDYICFRLK